MRRPPPSTTRPTTLFPDTTLFRARNSADRMQTERSRLQSNARRAGEAEMLIWQTTFVEQGGFRAAFFYWSNRTLPLALSARSALYSALIQPNLRLVSTGPLAPQANSRSRDRRWRRRQVACPGHCAASRRPVGSYLWARPETPTGPWRRIAKVYRQH